MNCTLVLLWCLSDLSSKALIVQIWRNRAGELERVELKQDCFLQMDAR